MFTERVKVNLLTICFVRAWRKASPRGRCESQIAKKAEDRARQDEFALGYYSALFEDPDGTRFEINYVPGRGLFESGARIGGGLSDRWLVDCIFSHGVIGTITAVSTPRFVINCGPAAMQAPRHSYTESRSRPKSPGLRIGLAASCHPRFTLIARAQDRRVEQDCEQRSIGAIDH
jgi:hypothetical protein